MGDARDRLRVTFDGAALRYDQARPGYPEALFDDVVALSGIPTGGRILEIGCGTGQATVPLARRGYRVLCVELGERLAEVARRNLAAYPTAEVWVGAFEAWPLAEGAFDLVVSATAFHWLDPAIAYPQAARALKPGGALALCWNLHVEREASGGFFESVQEVYRREAPELAAGFGPLPGEDAIVDLVGQIGQTGLFSDVMVRRYRWDATYDADGYLRLLATYSNHLRLDEGARERLFRGVADLIEGRFGGRITKGYLSVLYVARRR